MNLTNKLKPKSTQMGTSKGRITVLLRHVHFFKVLVEITLKNICNKEIYLWAETMLLTFMKYPVIFFREI